MMMVKGTEWLKADLHIHVPQTAMNDQYRLDAESKDEILNELQVALNKPDKFQLTPQEAAEPIQKKFLEELVNSDLDVIGLTDYFSVDNFDIYASKLRKKGKTVFPNVEFRLTQDAGRGHINLHVIFSDEVSTATISEMLKRLECNGKRLGEIPRSEYSNLTVSLQALKKELENTFTNREESYFVVVPLRGDGLFDPDLKAGISGRHRSVAKEVAQYADALFGNANDLHKIRTVEWGGTSQGIPKNKSLSAKQELVSRIGRPMAVFRGSDAHSFDRIRAFLEEGQFTWIRGLRDFSVLQQTVVEPISRLEISQRKPGVKSPAHVIRRVTFSDNGHMPNIEFNPGLNSVIGPRSSGKSTLLAHTAYAIDAAKTVEAQMASLPERAREELGPAEGFRWQDVVKELKVDVEWEDGEISSNSVEQGEKMVHYVPQNFLFQLSSGDRDNVDKLIQKQISQIGSAASIADRINDGYLECRQEVRKQAERFRTASMKRQEYVQKIRELGDQKALQNEFEESERALKAITAEGEDYGGQSALETLELKKEVEEAATKLQAAVGVAEEKLARLTPKVFWETFFGVEEGRSYFDSIYERVELAISDALKSISEEIESVVKEDADFSMLVQKNLQKYIEQNSLIERANAFSELRGARLADAKRRFEVAKARLEGYKHFRNQLEVTERTADKELSSLLQSYGRWAKESSDLSQEFEREVLKESGNSAYVNFVEFSRDSQKISNFNDFFLERKQDRDFKNILSTLEEVELSEEVITLVCRKLLNGEVKIAAKYRERDDLFTEFCDVLVREPRFGCKFEGDTIGGFQPSTMTAGKRALFALTVLLEDDDSPWPLLLDQPEDDLDSRSIFKTIAPFLRDGSLHRQIIMVTHNANLVVGADSDLTIVINRHSEDYPNGVNNPPLFSALSGALEETKQKEKPNSPVFLKRKGIKRHICDVVDGGRDAFEKREVRYRGVGRA